MRPSRLSDLGQRLLRFFLRQRLAVVVGVAAQKMLDGVALDRARDDDARAALALPGLLERGHHLTQVVAVDLLGEPAERLPARRLRTQVEHFRRRSRLLVAV